MGNLKFSRLSISQKVLETYFERLKDGGKNPAYVHEDVAGAVFMQYQEKGESFFTLVSESDYQCIKNEYWSGTNGYRMMGGGRDGEVWTA